MTLDDISRILVTLEATDVTECEIEHGTQSLRVTFDRTLDSDAGQWVSSTAASPVSAAPDTPDTIVVKSQATGIFRLRHPLLAAERIEVRNVRCGQPIGYLEIDSVFCAIHAPTDGVLKTILLEDGERVGYGQAVAEIHIERSS